MKKTLNQLRDEIQANSADHGFYQVEEETDWIGVDNRSAIEHAIFKVKIALIHSKLRDALEADRKNKRADLTRYNLATKIQLSYAYTYDIFKDYIKDSIEDELADVLIRVLDLCGHHGIDIERYVELRMEYKYKHGKNIKS